MDSQRAACHTSFGAAEHRAHYTHLVAVGTLDVALFDSELTVE